MAKHKQTLMWIGFGEYVSITIMLSASSDALLAIVSAFELGHVRVGINSTKEDRFVLKFFVIRASLKRGCEVFT